MLQQVATAKYKSGHLRVVLQARSALRAALVLRQRLRRRTAISLGLPLMLLLLRLRLRRRGGAVILAGRLQGALRAAQLVRVVRIILGPLHHHACRQGAVVSVPAHERLNASTLCSRSVHWMSFFYMATCVTSWPVQASLQPAVKHCRKLTLA